MSVRARAMATVGVLWALLVGAAIVTTVRRGGMKVIVGAQQPCSPGTEAGACVAQPRSILGIETQYDLARMFNWIGMASLVALVAIVITYVVTIRSASRAADEFEYEVVPTDRTGEPETRRRHLDLTA
jgi:hypothetical protein